jgi:hypothetical protein
MHHDRTFASAIARKGKPAAPAIRPIADKKLRVGRQFSAALAGMQGALPNNFNRSAEQV